MRNLIGNLSGFANIFTTADLGQAPYLMSRGHRFLGIEQTGQERVAFRFADTDDKRASETALDFANRGQSPAKQLIEAMRFLKTVLRDVRASKNKVESRSRFHDSDLHE